MRAAPRSARDRERASRRASRCRAITPAPRWVALDGFVMQRALDREARARGLAVALGAIAIAISSRPSLLMRAAAAGRGPVRSRSRSSSACSALRCSPPSSSVSKLKPCGSPRSSLFRALSAVVAVGGVDGPPRRTSIRTGVTTRRRRSAAAACAPGQRGARPGARRGDGPGAGGAHRAVHARRPVAAGRRVSAPAPRAALPRARRQHRQARRRLREARGAGRAPTSTRRRSRSRASTSSTGAPTTRSRRTSRAIALKAERRRRRSSRSRSSTRIAATSPPRATRYEQALAAPDGAGRQGADAPHADGARARREGLGRREEVPRASS